MTSDVPADPAKKQTNKTLNLSEADSKITNFSKSFSEKVEKAQKLNLHFAALRFDQHCTF